MLFSYSITNFKSIKRECKISFEASNGLKDNKKLLMNNQILPVVVIYGANGSGKTSILESIGLITNLLKAKNVNHFNSILNSISQFKNKSILEEDTTFIFEFLSDDGIIYKYEIVLSTNSVILERLSKKEYNSKQKYKNIFEIENNKINSNDPVLNSLTIDTKKISSIYYFNSIIKNEDINFVCNEIEKIIVFQINSINPIIYTPFSPTGMEWSFDIHLLKSQKNKFLKIFKEIDLNIKDIEIIKNQFNDYQVIFTKNSIYGEIKVNFFSESTGTQKIIQFLCDFIKFSKNGSIFCIDELDASLHPKLLAYVIELFNSENNQNSQLLYTSHDLYTLDAKFFRRDEIYFTGINESYFTDIISLNEYDNLNKSSSFSKKYIKGEVGYEPYISKVEKWNE